MYYGSQFAYENAEPDDNEIHESVYEKAAEEFASDWLAYTEIPDKAMDVLTKIAQGEKVNDIEMQAFKKELNHAYDIALEHYTDDNVVRIEKEMIEHNNSI